MSEELIELCRDEFKKMESRIEDLIRENEMMKKNKDRIDVLWVYPELRINKVVGPNFIEKLNKENHECEIKVQLISDRSLRQILEKIDDCYFEKFHILVMGSCDASGYYFYSNSENGLTEELATEKIMTFHKNGGKILLLHDAMFKLNFFDQILDGKEEFEHSFGKNVSFIADDHPLMKIPFEIPHDSSVAKTHQSYRYSKAKPIIKFSTKNEEYYYQEIEERRIAICEAMHSPSINGFEEKLIYNIIYRIFKWN